MDELATDPVEAVAVGGEVAAKCGLVLWMLLDKGSLIYCTVFVSLFNLIFYIVVKT
jgi:hypothetical protein